MPETLGEHAANFLRYECDMNEDLVQLMIEVVADFHRCVVGFLTQQQAEVPKDGWDVNAFVDAIVYGYINAAFKPLPHDTYEKLSKLLTA